MGNQYASSSFAEVLENRYNKPVSDSLIDLQLQGYTYQDICKLTGYKETTVRKYCRRYQIVLSNTPGVVPTHATPYSKLLTKIRVNGITIDNALYKNWGNYDFEV
ncbi:terminase gpP N-terminus-related DNA-binding protein [Fangia hongkongensis]|uniref:terminase gpP N-terminus-related DNA-binding protein n=1 Tax=Fangia hongkongensis TaxID=270495 RepID=UPI0003778690|nr:helix-turn-helix domain-containing protein [Fangia hongkongensis]MBK2126069.1 helix-turn-helix domain-containing protein [Fangia hongkongensis]